MGALALFCVIAGGTAYAANTIGSSDVIDNSLLSADLKNNQAVKSADVSNENLTGADIADQSGVDTCTHGTFRYGELCVVSDTAGRTWLQALEHCGGFELRLPSVGEAVSLAKNYDVPSVGLGQEFWTDHSDDGTSSALVATEDGTLRFGSSGNHSQTVCVTNPTN